MCTPAAAVAAATSIAGFAQQSAAVNAQNAATAQSHQDASLAAQRKYEGEQRSFISETKQALEKGYDATMRARESIGAARASSSFGGISFKNLISAERQKAANNAAKVDNYVSDARESFKSNVRGYEAEAQGRINATPFKASPSPLNLALDLLTIGVKATNKDPRPDGY